MADKYFDDIKVPCENKAGTTTETQCKCCHAPPFRAITGTKKVAHLLGIQNQGISACTHSLIELSRDEMQALAAATKSAKEWSLRGAGSSHPALHSHAGTSTLTSE